MGMFDSVSGALDSASQMLAGGANAPGGATADTDPKYIRGRNLDVDTGTVSAGQAPNLENALNGFPVIEFIHFGNVHTSHSNYFTHADYSDKEKNDKVKDGDRPRGIQFRSALEREAILLSVFMECTQTVLDERDKSSSMGGLGSALSTLGSMAGIGGGGSGKTGASDLNSHVQKVVAAAKPILPDAITYTNTHQAGIDFHQARANYRALLQKIVDEKPSADPTSVAGSLMGGLPGVSSIAGPFADVLTFTQGVAFKAQDVKAKFFVLAAQQQEPQIEMACNEMTLNAIDALANPFLPVWFLNRAKKGNETWDNAPTNPLDGDHGNLLNPLMAPVVGATDTARNDVVGAGNSVKKFFEPPPDDPPPGQDPLGIAFNDPPTPKGDKSIVPMKMGDVACQSFITALGLKPPLGFPETVVSGIVAVTLEFMQAVYKSILVRDANTVIDGAALLQSAREDIQIAKRLEDLAMSKLSFVKDAKNWKTPSVAGFQVNPGGLIDKGVGDLDELVANKIKPLLDPILEYAMKGLADQLELARQNGMNNTCHTMEWYLGRLPWVQATLFCNLFFPFWSALMKVVSDAIGGPVGGALKAIVGAADKLKGVVDVARDAMAKASALGTAATDTMNDMSSFNQSNFLGKADAAGSRFGQASKATASKTTGPTLDQGKFVIPVTGRSEKGQGQELKKSEYDQVSPKHKWDGAQDPAATDGDKKDDASTAAGAAGTPPAAANTGGT